MKTDKCDFIISGNKYESLWADIGNDNMRVKLYQASWNKYRQKLEIWFLYAENVVTGN